MYRVAICDDNAADGQRMLKLTKQILFERNLEADFSLYADPDDLLADIQKENNRYDLLLLDILFDKTDGINLAKSLRDKGERGAIIYTTDSRDYAVDGYKVQASDYLLKPIELKLLAESISRVLKRHDTLLVEVDGILRNIPISDIQYAESAGNYVILQIFNQKEVARMRATLSEAEQKLGPNRFARCHKGYLVNLGQIREVRTSHILLHDGAAVPLGRQYRIELRKRILNYVENAIPH